jgi:nucleotide-binding universal stress UspA family protein
VKTGFDKGILCTIDFSESSKGALQWAVLMAKELGLHLTILYAYRLVSSDVSEGVELKNQIEANATRHFAQLEKEVLKGSGVAYDFKTEIGFVSNRVKDHVKRNGLSFWVMGNHMGSTNRESIDELASNIDVPLVIVPQSETLKKQL